MWFCRIVTRTLCLCDRHTSREVYRHLYYFSFGSSFYSYIFLPILRMLKIFHPVFSSYHFTPVTSTHKPSNVTHQPSNVQLEQTGSGVVAYLVCSFTAFFSPFCFCIFVLIRIRCGSSVSWFSEVSAFFISFLASTV